MLALATTALCIGGLCYAYPHSGFHKKIKIKIKWNTMMKEKNIVNSLGKTFKIKNVKIKDDSYIFNLKIPVGMTEDKLQEIATELEYCFGGDVDIEWKKYDEIIEITVNKEQLSVR